MLRQGRDSTRMREIGTLHRAISMLRIDTPAAPLGSSNTIHVSIPSDSPTCANLGLPTPPPGWSYRCVSAANLRNIDNTGWIPIDFTVMPRGSPLASLPVDPVNTVASSNFYVFVTDGRTWTFASLLESERHAPSALRDGGTDSARFEVGNNLSLWTSASGLVGYWSFDEGTGTTARDLSGRGNTGTLVNNPTWVEGRVGRALSFDGVDDFVSIPHDIVSVANIRSRGITYMAWINSNNLTNDQRIVGQQIHLGFSDYSSGGIGIDNLGRALMIALSDANPSSYLYATGDVSLNNNRWHHIAGTFNPTDMLLRVYVNGIQQGTTPRIGLFSRLEGNHSNRIGRKDHVTTLSFRGLIDEVRIHNRALTEAEIRTIFNATR